MHVCMTGTGGLLANIFQALENLRGKRALPVKQSDGPSLAVFDGVEYEADLVPGAGSSEACWDLRMEGRKNLQVHCKGMGEK